MDGNCTNCYKGSICENPGVTIANMEVEPGYFRANPLTYDSIYECLPNWENEENN